MTCKNAETAPDLVIDGWFIYMIKLLDTGLRPEVERIAGSRGFTAAQYTALTVLLSRPGITSSELARRSFVRAQSMAGTIGPLIEQGLISRAQDPDNARRLLLRATPRGRAAVTRLQDEVAALQSRLVDGLDQQQLEALSAALRTLRHNVQDLSTSTP
ncbi:MarR family winged helix-turn-helix transcriptional regulator [Citricoccus zhacaiensis]|uniref:MarR family winged helix-turn-helix transcriptional regulator n=1 Tax=Citricoccus sp. K5 TaxID=2653135 RepID=UPI0012EF7920|nr:MarR family transcriptional regulator [Citricoccus sp. K5]VXA90802.1 DNA-binding MarR family transcriptional regulator [Citricoccus sp. K5]